MSTERRVRDRLGCQLLELLEANPRGRSSVGRASGLQPEGRGFESLRLHHKSLSNTRKDTDSILCPAATGFDARRQQIVIGFSCNMRSCDLRRVRSLTTRCGKWRIQVLCIFSGQATKGVRWMLGRREPTKDAAGCEKPRGAASWL